MGIDLVFYFFLLKERKEGRTRREDEKTIVREVVVWTGEL